MLYRCDRENGVLGCSFWIWIVSDIICTLKSKKNLKTFKKPQTQKTFYKKTYGFPGLAESSSTKKYFDSVSAWKKLHIVIEPHECNVM